MSIYWLQCSTLDSELRQLRRSVVVALGGKPMITGSIDVARAQLKGDKHGRRLWGLDIPPRDDEGGAPKRWFVATPAEVDEGYARLPPQDRHVYEVIDARRPCWAYFDLEFTRKDGLNAAVDGDALTKRVVSAACDRLMVAAGERPLEIEVIVLASARPTKFSRHVVLRPHWTDGARRAAPLAGSQHAGHLAEVVVKALGDALTVQSDDARTTSFVDTGVYTLDRCFRVWGSTKHGDDAGAAFAVRNRWLLPGLRPSARPFAPSPLRETLVVPELQPGAVDCLEIGAPVAPLAPPPPPSSPGAAEEAAAPAAPAAPVKEDSWEESWDGATATPLLDRTARHHPYIIARAGDRGQPPALFAAATAVALAALRRDHRDNGDPTLMSWRYVAAEYPSEPYLHLAVKGRGVVCRSRGRAASCRTRRNRCATCRCGAPHSPSASGGAEGRCTSC